MTLYEAYAITKKMRMEDHRDPSHEQNEAKWLIYREVISKQYADVPPHLEPDYMEGWK